jgi:hypothetical protein
MPVAREPTKSSDLRRSPFKRTLQNSYSTHWCENDLSDVTIFMASGWPAKGHGSLQ